MSRRTAGGRSLSVQIHISRDPPCAARRRVPWSNQIPWSPQSGAFHGPTRSHGPPKTTPHAPRSGGHGPLFSKRLRARLFFKRLRAPLFSRLFPVNLHRKFAVFFRYTDALRSRGGTGTLKLLRFRVKILFKMGKRQKRGRFAPPKK